MTANIYNATQNYLLKDFHDRYFFLEQQNHATIFQILSHTTERTSKLEEIFGIN